MTTEIRDALTAVRDAVDVPPLDDLAFRDRVRAEQRRRTSSRAVAGLVAATVVGVVGTLVVAGGEGGRGTDVAQPPVNDAGPSAPVPVSLDNRLALVRTDGSVVRSEVRVEEVVGSTADGVVVVGPDSQVRLVPVTGSGERTTFGTPRDLIGVPVQSAHLDKDGLALGFVDLDGTMHFREVGVETDYQTGRVDPGDAVLGINTGGWLTDSSSRGLVLHYRDDSTQTGVAFLSTQIGTAFAPETAELADTTLAVGTSDGVEVFDAPDGAPRFGGSLGGAVSSLAPGGDVVATATGSDQSDQGMSVGVWLLDAFTGDQMPMRDYDGGPAIDIAWVDDDEFAVLAGSGSAELWACSAAAQRCELRWEGAANAVRLPAT